MAERNDNHFPTDSSTLLIQVFYNLADPPFICGASGCLTVAALENIETDLDKSDFLHGTGSYLFGAHWFEGQFDQEGRCELPAVFELTFISFRPFPEEQQP